MRPTSETDHIPSTKTIKGEREKMGSGIAREREGARERRGRVRKGGQVREGKRERGRAWECERESECAIERERERGGYP